MNKKANKLWMAMTVVFLLTGSSLVQAFFCFSVGAGAGSKHRNRHYSAPYPPAGFGTFAYPLRGYSPILYSPVLQERASQALVPVAPVSSSDLMLEEITAEPGGGPARQQIFE